MDSKVHAQLTGAILHSKNLIEGTLFLAQNKFTNCIQLSFIYLRRSIHTIFYPFLRSMIGNKNTD